LRKRLNDWRKEKRNREEKVESMASKILDKSYDPHQVEEKWYVIGWIVATSERMKIQSRRPTPLSSPSQCDRFTPHWTRPQQYLQDILIRYKRMKDYTALWMPGTDHAGIATQNVVERQLMEEGLDRHLLAERSLSREFGNGRKSPAGRSSAS